MIDWKIADAKARFSDLVKKSELGPQVITKHGERVSVMLSYEFYQILKKQEQEGRVTSRIGRFLEDSAALRKSGGIELEIPDRKSRPGPDFSLD